DPGVLQSDSYSEPTWGQHSSGRLPTLRLFYPNGVARLQGHSVTLLMPLAASVHLHVTLTEVNAIWSPTHVGAALPCAGGKTALLVPARVQHIVWQLPRCTWRLQRPQNWPGELNGEQINKDSACYHLRNVADHRLEAGRREFTVKKRF
ncbi:uncharacterized protein LOC142864332, partial [Microcebus murinus]|uniref:uncharacterized protein LOC142864332 n=1 Tax=Microcebus murinus TaxID=30608 RepID=UPI003F6A9D40